MIRTRFPLGFILTALILLTVAPPVGAQGAGTAYAWIEADLALFVPEGWTVARTTGEDGAPILSLRPAAGGAETMVELRVHAHVPPDTDLNDVARDTLEAYRLLVTEARDGAYMAGGYGPGASGGSSDGRRYGIAHIARLIDGRVLTLSGHTAGNRAALENAIEATRTSLVPGADGGPFTPGYVAVWSRPDISPRAVAFGPDNHLYVVSEQHLFDFDAISGALHATHDYETLARATDITLGGDGLLYVAAPPCRCLRVYATDGAPQGSIGGFGDGAPTSVQAINGGWLYATDRGTNGVLIRAWLNGNELPSVALPTLAEQPTLGTTRDGRLSIHGGDGTALAFNGYHLAALGTDGDETSMAFDPLAPDGLVIDVAGGLTAHLFQPVPLRMGGESLERGVPVQGWLNAVMPTQAWTFDGQRGEAVTISAVEISRAGLLDVALRLIGPDGEEEAFNDDQLGLDLYGALDAQIAGHRLEATGRYTVVVERVDGMGYYRLGMDRSGEFALAAGGAVQLRGWLGDAVPTERWHFQGERGYVLTITMQSPAGTLDPLLRLVGPDGEVIAQNDDAADTALGLSAQLVRVELPTTGMYTLEARRYDGAGEYAIVVVTG